MRNVGLCFGAVAATGVVAAVVLYRRLRRAQETERMAVILRRLRERTTNKLSAELPITLGESGVDLSQVDVANLVNSMSDDTGYLIPDSDTAAFNRRWRRCMRVAFERNGNVHEFEEWLRTGLSNGRELRVQVQSLEQCCPLLKTEVIQTRTIGTTQTLLLEHVHSYIVVYL